MTCGNIGALPAAGGTLSGNITPNANNTLSLGSSSVKFDTVYATTFNGNATSATNATTATALNKSIKFSGSVDEITLSLDATDTTQHSVTLNLRNGVVDHTKIATKEVLEANLGDNSVTTLKIKNKSVTEDKLADLAVTEGKIATDAVTTNKIKDANITNAKLAADIGTVYVGATEPTDTHVKIWVNTNPSTKA